MKFLVVVPYSSNFKSREFDCETSDKWLEMMKFISNVLKSGFSVHVEKLSFSDDM